MDGQFPLGNRIEDAAEYEELGEAVNSYADVEMENDRIESVFFRSSLDSESGAYLQNFDLQLTIEDGVVAEMIFDYKL
ncbi:hypothetical protein [Salisediminibacterium selenitireducens]|uniref:Uncharacterized protein n=1 Tax=Bacillus selenitireducens (strain ATCC 700615 / DSM 15326 / MLS10) TaxID=439292 RepID=D6XXT9_BACIE|nr:hypothetical protein [Salisediminibacterium selenitireducens]ADI00132.1 hypothetical protein Bsel_2632 [[Bacillus] selenitireducens MLS10]